MPQLTLQLCEHAMLDVNRLCHWYCFNVLGQYFSAPDITCHDHLVCAVHRLLDTTNLEQTQPSLTTHHINDAYLIRLMSNVLIRSVLGLTQY